MSPLEIMKSCIGQEFSASPSPFMHWLNPVVKSVETGALEFEYRVRPEWLNPIGNLHGGVTAAIVDDVLGATMFSLNEAYFYTTINNVIDYFSTANQVRPSSQKLLLSRKEGNSSTQNVRFGMPIRRD
ncbi:PaaI family thioesterase [Sphingobacterium sp. KU25419]|nr:PaaI family thioesterase [Sphingobacterium sp. KU25419]